MGVFRRLWMALLAAMVSLTVIVAPGGSAAANDPPRPQRYVQIVAHEDDDTLFMNPDLSEGIRSGFGGVTVYLTTGDNQPQTGGSTSYMKGRQDGALNAYRYMAGVTGCEDRGCYHQTALTLGSVAVQEFTLNANPTIQLVFFDLPDGIDDGTSCALAAMWRDGVDGDTSFRSQVPDDSSVAVPQTFTHRILRDALVTLLNQVQPTVIRSQDPAPDMRYVGGWSCLGLPDFHDHYDHVSAARFADEAAQVYGGPGGNGRVVVEHYRDYNIGDEPPNVSPGPGPGKLDIFTKYLHRDDGFQYDPLAQDANGDPLGVYVSYCAAMYYRWSRGSAFVGKNQDGRLQVFVVENGRVYTWWQTSGDSYAGPVDLGNPGVPLTAGISVGNNQDGRLEIFAVGADADAHIYTTYQSQVNGAWVGHWDDMGSPNAAVLPERKQMVSTPGVANNGDGRLEIFVTNGGGGMSTKWQVQNNGAWSDWLDEGEGPDIQGQPAAITTNDGRIEVFASTRNGVKHWYQHVPNQGFLVDNGFPVVSPASPPAVAKNQDGRQEVFVREAGTSNLIDIYQTQVSAAYTSVVHIPVQGGIGESAALTSPDGRIMVFTRNGGTGVSMVRQKAPNMGYDGAPPADLGGVTVNTVAAGRTTDGRVVVFSLGIDGRVYIIPQTSPGADAPFRSPGAIGTS